MKTVLPVVVVVVCTLGMIALFASCGGDNGTAPVVTPDPDALVWQNPKPQGNLLYDVHMLDGNNAIAITDVSVMRSSDGGATWSIEDRLDDSGMRSIDFFDATSGVIVGGDVVLTTNDGGDSWTRRQTPNGFSATAVAMVSPTMMFVSGNGVWRSTDSGNTWAQVFADAFNFYFAIEFVGTDVGFVSADSRVYKTVDAGGSWQDTGRDFDYVKAIQFVDANRGWALGQYDLIYATTDGGATWTEYTPLQDGIEDMFFFDANSGVIVGSDGVQRTANGGATWTAVQSDFFARHRHVSFGDGIHGVTVGYGGDIEVSSNAGFSWQEVSQTVHPGTLRGVEFISSNEGLAVGVGILRTVDGGDTWSEVYSLPSPAYLDEVAYVTATDVVAVGRDARIVRSTNAGLNWIDIPHGINSNYVFRSVKFRPSGEGWIAGDLTIAKSNDGGLTWAVAQNLPLILLTGIEIVSPSVIVAVGADESGSPPLNYIVRSADGGVTWTPAALTPTQGRLQGVAFANETDGLAVGGFGSIWLTTDGGATWAPQTVGNQDFFNNVEFVSGTKAFLMGTNKYYTDDAGITFTRFARNVTSGFYAADFLNPSEGFFVGGEGTIMKTTTGGL